MSKPMADSSKRRARRQFTHEFKASAVCLVLDEGKSVGAVACDLDLTETALREWVKRAQADRTHGRTGLTTAEREELARLRKENRQLRVLVHASFTASKGRYGSPRTHRDLREDHQERVSRKRNSVDAGERAQRAAAQALQMHDDE
jgi:transposase